MLIDNFKSDEINTKPFIISFFNNDNGQYDWCEIGATSSNSAAVEFESLCNQELTITCIREVGINSTSH